MAEREAVGMNLRVISKHRNVIYGFAIIWIVLFHAAANNKIDFSFGFDWLVPLDFFIRKGNVGVDAFLFLSGVCMYFSFVRDPDISSFMRKRLVRIIPATYIVYGVFWLVRDAVLRHNLLEFLSRMTLMRFWMTGDKDIWFVSLILVLYAGYPYLFCLFFGKDGKETHLGRFLITVGFVYAFTILFCYSNHDLFDMAEAAVTRMPAFIIGAWAGKFVYESRRVGRGWIVASVVAVVLFFWVMAATKNTLTLPASVTGGPYVRWFFLVGAVGIVFCIALVCQVFDAHLDMRKRPVYRFLAWTGTFSFELYLTHMMFGLVMRALPFYTKGDLPLYLAMTAISFVSAWAVSKIAGRISASQRRG